MTIRRDRTTTLPSPCGPRAKVEAHCVLVNFSYLTPKIKKGRKIDLTRVLKQVINQSSWEGFRVSDLRG